MDPGQVFRRVIAWLPPHFASQSDAPIGAPRQFGSTDHLSTEAIAAYADGELTMKAHLRAAHHLSICPQCAAEVDSQGQARTALRESRPVTMPSTLMGLLSQIPHSQPQEPVPGPGFEDPWADGTNPDRRKRR